MATQAPSKTSLVTSSIHRLCGGTCPYSTVLLQDVKRVCYTHKICNNFIVKVFSRPHTLYTPWILVTSRMLSVGIQAIAQGAVFIVKLHLFLELESAD